MARKKVDKAFQKMQEIYKLQRQVQRQIREIEKEGYRFENFEIGSTKRQLNQQKKKSYLSKKAVIDVYDVKTGEVRTLTREQFQRTQRWKNKPYQKLDEPKEYQNSNEVNTYHDIGEAVYERAMILLSKAPDFPRRANQYIRDRINQARERLFDYITTNFDDSYDGLVELGRRVDTEDNKDRLLELFEEVITYTEAESVGENLVEALSILTGSVSSALSIAAGDLYEG